MGPLVAILLAGAVESFQVAAYNETQVEGRKLVYDANCARRIFTPTPRDNTARYQATVLFDCGATR